MNKKIIAFKDLSKIKSKFKNKKIVHCHGVFDLFHNGHLKYLNSAKKYGDILVVSVTSDKYVNKGPGRPRFNENDRALMLSSLSVVDFVVINNGPLAVNVISKLKPDFYVKGKDYTNKKKDLTKGIYKEERELKKINGKLIFTNDELNSSTVLINEHFSQLDQDQKKAIQKIKKKFSIDKIINYINRLQNEDVFILGEPIIDQYIFCRPMNLSSKSPSISTNYLYKEDYAGGVLAIARQAAALGCNVKCSFIANSEKITQKIFKDIKKDKMIKLDYIKNSKIPTPIKTRFIEPKSKQRMFEIVDIKSDYNENVMEKNLLKKIKLNFKKNSLNIVADFGHGLINNQIIDYLNKFKHFLSINVQTNSENYGFNLFTKYKNYQYLSIDERECRLGLHERYADIFKLGRSIHNKTKSKLAITLEKRGSVFFSNNKSYFCPAFYSNPIDTTGAGDAFFLITSLLVKSKCEPELIPFVGNMYAGLATQIIGNSEPVKKIDLIRSINSILS
jgi:rfaE bifunctional protein nucleotidyltransferase chain/domain